MEDRIKKVMSDIFNIDIDLINNNSDTYKCYMTETSNKEIIISGVRKFFIISYESVLHTVGLCDISLT